MSEFKLACKCGSTDLILEHTLSFQGETTEHYSCNDCGEHTKVILRPQNQDDQPEPNIVIIGADGEYDDEDEDDTDEAELLEDCIEYIPVGSADSENPESSLNDMLAFIIETEDEIILKSEGGKPEFDYSPYDITVAFNGHVYYVGNGAGEYAALEALVKVLKQEL